MYHPDLSLYCTFEKVYNIGYLDKAYPFAQRKAELSFVEKLVAMHKRENTNRMRSLYHCNLCANTNYYGDIPEFGITYLGAGEIWVPDIDTDVIYVAPDLIIHYV